MKVMFVFGTRPEAIKMAPLIKIFEKYPQNFETIVCVTGQHREMLDQVLKLFEIVPHHDLSIMKKGQDLYDITSMVLLGMKNLFKQVQPDVVFVHGDTTTSTATALASFYQQIPVAHIEAGLRTHNIYNPWPEEINRQLTSRITTFNFCPTILSSKNLIKEGINKESIIITGNTVIDALYEIIEKIKNDNNLKQSIINNLISAGYDSNRLTDGKKLILITGHRRENFGTGFINICEALRDLTIRYPDIDFVYPVHLNPNVRKPIKEVFNSGEIKNIFLIEPLDYLNFVFLMDKSYLILTDSGGIQEEAPSLGKPVLVMRNTTERPEALNAGTVKLVGTDYLKIIGETSRLIDDDDYYISMKKAINPYGDGMASKRILNYFLNNMDKKL